MKNKELPPLKFCPVCSSERSITRDDRTFCYYCEDVPLVMHTSIQLPETPSTSNSMANHRIKMKVLESKPVAWVWRVMGRKHTLLGSSVVGIILLGTGLFLGFKNVAPSSASLRSEGKDVVVLGDTFIGYSSLRSTDFLAVLKSKGINLKYANEFIQATRAQRLSSGEADLMVTTLDQVIKHQPDGKIVGILDYTQGADAVALNTKQFPFLKDISSLTQEVKKAAKYGQRYSIVYAEDTPSEYLTLVLANKFPGIRLEQFNKIPVEDASEAYKLLQDPSNNIAVAVLWDPYVTQARKQGYKVVLTSADVPETIVDVLVASDDFIETEPEQLEQLIASYYSRIDGTRLDAAALIQQIAKEAEVVGSDAFNLYNGIRFFNALEAKQWMTSGKLKQRADYTGSVLKASGRISQLPVQSEHLFTGKFLKLAVANTTDLEQKLQDQALQAAQPTKPQENPFQTQAEVISSGDISETIQFELSSILLDNEDKEKLNTLLQKANSFGANTDIQVTGHTSLSDSPERDQVLSKAQVESVASYVRSREFSGKLIAKREGSNFPVSGTDPGDPTNERVEVSIVTRGE